MAANPEPQIDERPARAARRVPTRPPDEPLLAAPAAPDLIEGPHRDDIIRRRAFELFEREGCVNGRALDHWLAAESELDRVAVDGLAAVADLP